MQHKVIGVVLILAYGPLAVMALLWIAAAVLRALGRPGMADWLGRRTSIPERETFPGEESHSH